MHPIQSTAACCAVIGAVLIAGCGSASSSSTTTPSGSGAGALAADARSAATGDIPDNQVFLALANSRAGYSIKYPEGWTQRGSGSDVTFSDKNNLVHVLIAAGPSPTPASVSSQLNALKRSEPTLTFAPPSSIRVGAGLAVKAVYTTRSAPNPVTGKRVKLIVDRYELARAGRVATVDLGTPQGVDNVDAYRLMIDSFRWR
jgi:hypothetical protein